MKKIYFNISNDPNPKEVEIGEDVTVGDLIKQISPGSNNEESYHLFLIDSDEFLNPEFSLNQCGIKHKHHVICHKCKVIRVSISFNGHDFILNVTPGQSIANLIKLAAKHFKIEGDDAANLVLKSDGGVTLLSTLHIGQLVHDGHNCEVKLILTPKVFAQG